MPERLLTSQRNALAVTQYAGQVALGLVYLLTVATSENVKTWGGPGVHALWVGATLAGGLAGLLAVYEGPKRRTLSWLYVEQGGCGLMAVAGLLYVAALQSANPGLAVLQTKMMVAIVAVGGIVRLCQIERDRTRTRTKMTPGVGSER